MSAVGAVGPTPARLEKARRARELRDDGASIAEIAVALGMSRAYASELLLDPNGAKARQRKESYAPPCPRCGAPRCGSGGPNNVPQVCANCTAELAHENRYWTPERSIEVLREFKEKTGRTPAAGDVIGHEPSQRGRFSPERMREISEAKGMLPSLVLFRREFGSWGAAIRAAGLEPCSSGGAGHRQMIRGESPARQHILRALADGPKTIVELGKSRRFTVRQLEKDGVLVSERPSIPGVRGRGVKVYRLNEGRETMGRIYTVMRRDENGAWEQLNERDALTPEQAIEQSAAEAGEYLAVETRFVRVAKVAPVNRLAIIEEVVAS